jgi:DNA-binding helix-hairpin-helix protein with protein kinase domain
MPYLFVRLFRRAFLSTDRPRPREWIEPLDGLAKALKKCDLHSGHYYYRELRDCPWCGIESQARVRLFNFLIPGDDSRRGHFRLHEIWKEIESVETPYASLIQRDKILKPPEPSEEVAAFAADRESRLTRALIFSAIAGLAIALLLPLPFALIMLILAGMFACGIARAEPLSLGNIQLRHRQAEEEARRLQEQYDHESEKRRWSAKRDELLNQKETYENLAKIRQFKLQELEAEAREIQLWEFLDRFEINDAEIKGIAPPIKAALLSHGVETAADVTEDVSRIPSVGRSQAERLLEWRRSLEGGFVFDPARGVPHEARVKTEREVDALRFRLEKELSGGAQYLRRMKQEIETSSQKRQSLLTQARHELVRARKDLAVASERNSPLLILAALIIAFFIGWVIKL